MRNLSAKISESILCHHCKVALRIYCGLLFNFRINGQYYVVKVLMSYVVRIRPNIHVLHGELTKEEPCELEQGEVTSDT